MNLLIETSRFDRMNRITTKDSEKETEAYHVRQAKFCVSTSSVNTRNNFVRKTKINKAFYKGGDNQWMFEEDLEAFLKDDTGQDRNRIKIVNNLIKPLVNQYKGNANRLDLTVRAESISETAKTRKTEALKEKMFMFEEYMSTQMFKNAIKNAYQLGDTQEETEIIFHNTYIDEYVDKVNKMIHFIEKTNRIEKHKIKLAENLALSGLAVMYCFEDSGHLKFEPIESEDFIFDNSAKRYDLSDSEFMGMVEMMIPTRIYERFNIKGEKAEAIENYVNNIGAANNTIPSTDNTFSSYNTNVVSNLKMPVYKIYFKDVSMEEWGYVIDEYGYKHLVQINVIQPGEEKPKYTEEDLIDPPVSSRNQFLFKGKKKVNIYHEVLRYCYFIPSEFLASAEKDENKRKDIIDLVLDYGVYPYQESTLENPSEVKFPFKAYTWGYIDGDIISPIDDAISPQRFVNRILSATEANINNAGGSNTVIDEDALNAEDVKDGSAARDIKQGKPIFVRTKGRGVPNVVGYYDNTPKEGVYKMFDIIPAMRDIIQTSTGVNEPLQGGGTQGGGTQLVGVTELLIQRGSLMQEPFYKAIEEIYIQMYEAMITTGKMIYTENERVLSYISGDESVYTFQLNKDVLNEEFRIFVKRENNQDVLKSQANQTLMALLEIGIIDQKVFANLYNRSTPDQVSSELRKFSIAKAEAERQVAKMQQQQAEQMAIQQDADLALAKEEAIEAEQRELQNFAQKEAIKGAQAEEQKVLDSIISNKF